MFLSIIVPVYKVEKYIKKCLLSCANQDYPSSDYEIIVVNDGSPDKSLSIANSIAADYSNIRIVSQENKGLSEARNTGLDNAVGDYVWFVDSDDWIENNSINILSQFIKDKQIDVVHIQRKKFKDDGKVITFPEYKTTQIISGVEMLKRYYGSPCAPLNVMRREFLVENNLRFFPGILFEDAEFTPRMFFYAQKVRLLNTPLYNIYVRSGSITQSISIKHIFDKITVANHLYLFMKNNYVPKETENNFYTIMSILVNGGFDAAINYKQLDINQFNEELNSKPYLLRGMIKSNFIRHKIEGLAFFMFKNYLSVYRFLNIYRKPFRAL